MAWICHCNAVRERTIVRAVRHGATSTEAVGQVCGAGTSCGGCRPAIDAIVASQLTAATAPPTTTVVAYAS